MMPVDLQDEMGKCDDGGGIYMMELATQWHGNSSTLFNSLNIQSRSLSVRYGFLRICRSDTESNIIWQQS